MERQVRHGKDAQGEHLGPEVLLQEHEGGHQANLSQHVDALVPVEPLAVVVEQEHVPHFDGPVLEVVTIPVELSKNLEGQSSDVEGAEDIPQLHSRIVLGGFTLNGQVRGQNGNSPVQIAALKDAENNLAHHAVREEPKHLAHHHEHVQKPHTLCFPC